MNNLHTLFILILFVQFSRHSMQFWTTLFFFHVWQKMFYIPNLFLFFGGGANNPKIIFDQFSRHFMPFRPILIFFYFPGWLVGWVVGWGKSRIKLISVQLSWSFGLSLAIQIWILINGFGMIVFNPKVNKRDHLWGDRVLECFNYQGRSKQSRKKHVMLIWFNFNLQFGTIIVTLKFINRFAIQMSINNCFIYYLHIN